MNKKLRNILACALVLMVAVAGIVYALSPLGKAADDSTANSTNEAPPVAMAKWVDGYSSADSMIDSAALIIKGTVVDSYTEQRVDMIFTKQVIEINKVYKGDLIKGEKIEVIQTGGEMNGIKTIAIEEAPLFDKSGTYLLFLRHSDEGHYLVMGGYQGVGQINKDMVTFNEHNQIITKDFYNQGNSVAGPLTVESLMKVPTTIKFSDVETFMNQKGLNVQDSK